MNIIDGYRRSVEAASGGKNTVLYDDKGNPSTMVVIPKFRLCDIKSDWPAQAHPAFIVEGREINEIYIGKYASHIVDGRALSLPGVDPTAYVNFDTMKNASDAKGPGWHLINNAEWSAIALWCRKSGFTPRGNTNYGRSDEAPHETGRITGDSRTATGSGPAAWYHDGTPFGIADLVGDVWDWTEGMKLVDGKIYVHGEDGTPMNNYRTKNKHRDVTGWLDTGAYYDGASAGRTDGNRIGVAILNNKRSNPMYTTDGSSDANMAYADQTIESLATASGYTPPEMLKWLCLMPIEGETYDGDYLWTRNYGERLPLRGGSLNDRMRAGLCALNLNEPRSNVWLNVGGRVAFVL